MQFSRGNIHVLYWRKFTNCSTSIDFFHRFNDLNAYNETTKVFKKDSLSNRLRWSIS